MDQSTVTCFRRGEIDTRVLQRMLGDVEQINILQKSCDVTIKVINTMTIGKDIIKVCPVDKYVWKYEAASAKLSLMDTDGKILQTIDTMKIQSLSPDKLGNVHMSDFQKKRITLMTNEHSLVEITSTAPLYPQSFCVTHSGDILVALVDVSISDFGKSKQTYIARLNNQGNEKQRIQFQEDNQTKLFNYAFYVHENKNADIVVLDQITRNKARLHIVSNKGNLKHSYNGTSQYFTPVSVCSDDQCRIIVSDVMNNALHLLNERAELLQLLMTEKDGLIQPYSLGMCDGLLWIGTRKGKLIVAEYNVKLDFKVLICSFISGIDTNVLSTLNIVVDNI